MQLMPDLTAAHRGYEYQDLLAAARSVDMLLGSVVDVRVDEKLVPHDRFDDLTVVDKAGRRQRTQFKHKDNDDQPLTLATFTTDARDLRLDKIVAAVLADRDGPGAAAPEAEYRIVLRDARPVDERLLAVLRPADPDPGPFLEGMTSSRMRFDARRLWRQAEPPTDRGRESFVFPRDDAAGITSEDLSWACERLIVEVEAPPARWDLLRPGLAEQLLLDRLRHEIGVETYPNENRSAADAAGAIIALVRGARQRTATVSRQELLHRTQLRHDFGAVARLHPVDAAVEIAREATTRSLLAAAATGAGAGGKLLVTGSPGQGKSWACQQLVDSLIGRGWLVAEHYCYLSDADGDRVARVATESLFGSLLGRLAEADPTVVAEQRPRFAADEDAVVNAVTTTLSHDPARRVALIVDGIDHVTRVRGQGGAAGADPSLVLAEALAELELPTRSVLIVLSQPGRHLQPLHDAGSAVLEVPGLVPNELRMLAAALAVVPGTARATPSLLTDDSAVTEFLDLLHQRSAGNALYATYLCREILQRPIEPVDPASALAALPTFDGTLENYYRHIYATLNPDSSWIADVIAVVDFALTRDELEEIQPWAAHRIDAALEALKPVLVERSAQGGIRVYHESFARFLRTSFQGNETASTALLGQVAAWLDTKGMFDDVRAFRSLLPILAEAGRDQEVVARVDRNFVVNAVAAGFPASAATAALTVAVGSAARVEDWAAVVRMVELARAASTFQWERYETTAVEFADVQAALLGADTLADRLLHEGRTVMSARAGLQMCAAVDRLGAVPPWREYMNLNIIEAEHDNTSYGADSNQTVDTAWLRGRLRLSAACGGSGPPSIGTGHPTGFDTEPDIESDAESGGIDISAPVNWIEVARFCEEKNVPAVDVVAVVADTYGPDAAIAFLRYLDNPGEYCLALAEATAAGYLPDDQTDARHWAQQAIAHGVHAGSALRLHQLGVSAGGSASSGYDRTRFLELTRTVQASSVRFEPHLLDAWLDACAVAAVHDGVGANTAEALIDGPGWYPCWLRFALTLMCAQARPSTERGSAALHAVRLLQADLNPFAGDPRACDLYPIHDRITDTVRRALQLVDEEDWQQALVILDQVSDGTSTTFRGELGGPLARDVLVRLAFETAPASQQVTVAQLAATHAEARSAGTYYSDVAEFLLIGARTALAQGDKAGAQRLWQESCRLLVAYGWRKDITIYELLDSLPFLIRADPARGRARVAAVQPLCERIPRHTDGRETRHARARWWELLAAADPAALAELTTPALLSSCNDPHQLLDDARTDLWRAWHHQADPIVAGALRLSLNLTVDPADPAQLRRLADAAKAPGTATAEHLATLLLARADERPYRYPYSDSDKHVARDSTLVAEMNAALDGVVAPASALPEPADPPEHSTATPRATSGPKRAGGHRPQLKVAQLFPSGPAGLARAVRAWRARHYSDTSHAWTFDQAVNVLGYRLLELAQSGRTDDATAALHSIASGGLHEDNPELLKALAAGLHRHGAPTLAATAYTLAWTRTRAGGGFLSFGGETELDAVRRGAEIDPSRALSVVGEEIQAVLRRTNGGVWGITQALVIALASGAWTTGPEPSVDTAFRVWDEAHAVIAARAPRVHPTDDPAQPYRPPLHDEGEPAPGGVDQPLATATIAGLASASRETKRRALLATELILTERPDLCAAGLPTALATISCVATLSWLLQILLNSSAPQSPALAHCATALTDLAARPQLSIRVMARQLLGEHTRPPLAAPAPADPELLTPPVPELWTPGGETRSRPTHPSEVAESIHAAAGARLDAAELMLPGLTAAVERRITIAMADPELEERMARQLRTFAGPRRDHWPDAFLSIYEAVEDALQSSAGGGRTARFSRGMPLQDPQAWEDALGPLLVDNPALALALDHTRRPRPDIPLPTAAADQAGTTRGTDRRPDSAATPHHAESTGRRQALSALHDQQEAPMVDGLQAVWAGWRVFASVERLTTAPPYPSKDPHHVTWRIRTIELGAKRRRPLPATPPSMEPPVAHGDFSDWWTAAPGTPPSLPHGSRSLVALDADLAAAGDAHGGLGLPDRLIAPTRPLIHILGLGPSEDTPFLLCHRNRPAMALVTWRCLYDTSDYHLPRPRLVGSAILIRPSTYGRLADWAQGRLVHRDYTHWYEQHD
jgi:hypothetical protein